MSPGDESAAIAGVVERLTELLGQEPTATEIEPRGGIDLVVAFGDRRFSVEYKSAADVAAVAVALQRLSEADVGGASILAVPFMGEAGRRLCAEAGVGWLDLSGNAHIVGPGLRVHVEGKPNRFKRPGRPSSVFAPKSARLARWLLMHRDEPISQTDLARATGMDPGFTSRIVRRLIEDQLVKRQPDRKLVVPNPGLLLAAWAEEYRFDGHRVVRGVIAGRSGSEVARRLSEVLDGAGTRHAFTGLVAAWQYTQFATFRTATVFLPDGVTEQLQEELGFLEGARGANTWLVVPDDEGVLHGAGVVGGLRCVHPVQAWLDLSAHPERAQEAAEQLKGERLEWANA